MIQFIGIVGLAVTIWTLCLIIETIFEPESWIWDKIFSFVKGTMMFMLFLFLIFLISIFIFIIFEI